MNKEAALNEIYQEAYNDELEKIAVSTSLLKRALVKKLRTPGKHRFSDQGKLYKEIADELDASDVEFLSKKEIRKSLTSEPKKGILLSPSESRKRGK